MMAKKNHLIFTIIGILCLALCGLLAVSYFVPSSPENQTPDNQAPAVSVVSEPISTTHNADNATSSLLQTAKPYFPLKNIAIGMLVIVTGIVYLWKLRANTTNNEENADKHKEPSLTTTTTTNNNKKSSEVDPNNNNNQNGGGGDQINQNDNQQQQNNKQKVNIVDGDDLFQSESNNIGTDTEQKRDKNSSETDEEEDIYNKHIPNGGQQQQNNNQNVHLIKPSVSSDELINLVNKDNTIDNGDDSDENNADINNKHVPSPPAINNDNNKPLNKVNNQQKDIIASSFTNELHCINDKQEKQKKVNEKHTPSPPAINSNSNPFGKPASSEHPIVTTIRSKKITILPSQFGQSNPSGTAPFGPNQLKMFFEKMGKQLSRANTHLALNRLGEPAISEHSVVTTIVSFQFDLSDHSGTFPFGPNQLSKLINSTFGQKTKLNHNLQLNSANTQSKPMLLERHANSAQRIVTNITQKKVTGLFVEFRHGALDIRSTLFVGAEDAILWIEISFIEVPQDTTKPMQSTLSIIRHIPKETVKKHTHKKIIMFYVEDLIYGLDKSTKVSGNENSPMHTDLSLAKGNNSDHQQHNDDSLYFTFFHARGWSRDNKQPIAFFSSKPHDGQIPSSELNENDNPKYPSYNKKDDKTTLKSRFLSFANNILSTLGGYTGK